LASGLRVKGLGFEVVWGIFGVRGQESRVLRRPSKQAIIHDAMPRLTIHGLGFRATDLGLKTFDIQFFQGEGLVI